MKRILFLLVTSLALCSDLRAEVGLWFGPKAIYFQSSNSSISQDYWPFWGFGGEGGWVLKKHLELGLNARYVRTNRKNDLLATDWMGNVIFRGDVEVSYLVVSPRISYRVEQRNAPYLGAGVGYYRGAVKYIGRLVPLSGDTSSAIGSEVFIGYDLRCCEIFGLRAEVGLQLAFAKEKARFPASPLYGNMVGYYVDLGTYLPW